MTDYDDAREREARETTKTTHKAGPVDLGSFIAQHLAAQQASEQPCRACGVPCPRGPGWNYCDLCGGLLSGGAK